MLQKIFCLPKHDVELYSGSGELYGSVRLQHSLPLEIAKLCECGQNGIAFLPNAIPKATNTTVLLNIFYFQTKLFFAWYLKR